MNYLMSFGFSVEESSVLPKKIIVEEKVYDYQDSHIQLYKKILKQKHKKKKIFIRL